MKPSCVECLALGGFNHQQCVCRKPAAIAQTFQRGRDQIFAIGRIEEDQIERPASACAQWPQIGGIAPPDLGYAGKSQSLDIFALKRAAFGIIVHQQAEACALDSASMPNAPVPAKRSATAAFSSVNPMPKSRCSRILKIAWRVRSEVGRTRSSSGATSRLPPNFPPVTLMPTRPFVALT